MSTDFFTFTQLYSKIPRQVQFSNTTSADYIIKCKAEIESDSNVDRFFGMKVESIVTKVARSPEMYNELYDKYKECATVLQKLYNKVHKNR